MELRHILRHLFGAQARTKAKIKLFQDLVIPFGQSTEMFGGYMLRNGMLPESMGNPPWKIRNPKMSAVSVPNISKKTSVEIEPF